MMKLIKICSAEAHGLQEAACQLFAGLILKGTGVLQVFQQLIQQFVCFIDA